MNKFLQTLILAGTVSLGANAVWLPNPVITSETTENGKTKIEWSMDDSEKYNYFQVIVYKMHVAQEDEKFVLASSDFSNLESTGTINKSEERGALWDYLPDNPGWWVRSPLYMQNAMGIDAFNYFAGSDNSDIFNGAYLLSPDYDLTNLQDDALHVSAELGAEATSVSGGFCVWAWNTNWVDPTNIDYKPITTLDYHYSLPNTTFKAVEETCLFPNVEDYTDPDDIDEVNGICKDRVRVLFYGRGYSAYWINKFEVSVNMKKGDRVDYGAAIHKVEGNSFEIDHAADTEADYTYAYEVRAVREDYDDYRNLTTIRFINYPYNTPKKVIGKDLSSISAPTTDLNDVQVRAEGGKITISAAADANAEIYTIAGNCIYNGPANASVNAENGVYIVKVGTKTYKLAL